MALNEAFGCGLRNRVQESHADPADYVIGGVQSTHAAQLTFLAVLRVVFHGFACTRRFGDHVFRSGGHGQFVGGSGADFVRILHWWAVSDYGVHVNGPSFQVKLVLAARRVDKARVPAARARGSMTFGQYVIVAAIYQGRWFCDALLLRDIIYCSAAASSHGCPIAVVLLLSGAVPDVAQCTMTPPTDPDPGCGQERSPHRRHIKDPDRDGRDRVGDLHHDHCHDRDWHSDRDWTDKQWTPASFPPSSPPRPHQADKRRGRPIVSCDGQHGKEEEEGRKGFTGQVEGSALSRFVHRCQIFSSSSYEFRNGAREDEEEADTTQGDITICDAGGAVADAECGEGSHHGWMSADVGGDGGAGGEAGVGGDKSGLGVRLVPERWNLIGCANVDGERGGDVEDHDDSNERRSDAPPLPLPPTWTNARSINGHTGRGDERRQDISKQHTRRHKPSSTRSETETAESITDTRNVSDPWRSPPMPQKSKKATGGGTRPSLTCDIEHMCRCHGGCGMVHDGPPMEQWAAWRADGFDESPDTVHHTVGAQREKDVFCDEIWADPSLEYRVDSLGVSRGRVCRDVDVDECAARVSCAT